MTTKTCNTTYTTRDGGSTLICTEPKGHGKGGLAGHGHYSDGRQEGFAFLDEVHPMGCRNCGSRNHTFCNR